MDFFDWLFAAAGGLVFIYIAARVVSAVWFDRKHKFLKALEAEHPKGE